MYCPGNAVAYGMDGYRKLGRKLQEIVPILYHPVAVNLQEIYIKISCTWTDAWYIVCPVQFLYISWYRKFHFWPSINCLMPSQEVKCICLSKRPQTQII